MNKNTINETVIPVNINTGYLNEATGILGNVRAARQQIEKTALYVNSLFNLIKISKVAVIDQDFENARLADYLENIEHVCELGSALSRSLLSSIAPVEQIESDIEDSERKSGDPLGSVGSNDSQVSGDLAFQFSSLLRNPFLPEKVFDSLMRTVSDISNEADSDALNKLESSPEYLEAVFSAYLKKERGQNG